MAESTELSRRDLLRGAVLVGGVGGLGVLGGGVAYASAPALVPSPEIHGTEAWGARPSSEPVTIRDYRPDKIVVHHTATANRIDYSLVWAYTLSRAIQNWHMDHNRWIDTGQNFTISRGGYVTEGRHHSLETLHGGVSFVHGAHAGPANGSSIGIENEGTYVTVAPTDMLYASLVDFCAYACQQYAIEPARIFGHRDFMSTQCPGNVLYGMLPQLRRDVADKLGQSPPPLRWPTVFRGDGGERVRTVQHLLRHHGATITADGAFGPATDEAVRGFQTANELESTGAVRQETWQELIVVLRTGSTGEPVTALQRQLRYQGFDTAVDGQFGPQTGGAVRAFQDAHGLTSSGVVEPPTWKALVA
ncbi:MAG: peptidoglycan recognition protein family protein [Micromonosporaceae bacterium]